MNNLTWGLNGYGERCWYCGNCHKVMGMVRKEDIVHSCGPEDASTKAIRYDESTIRELQIPVRKVTAAEFDGITSMASDARASLLSCCGKLEKARETQWVLRAVLKMQYMELKRKNADRLDWRARMVMHCCNTVMASNGWTVLQLTTELRKTRAQAFYSGYFD